MFCIYFDIIRGVLSLVCSLGVIVLAGLITVCDAHDYIYGKELFTWLPLMI